MPRTGEVDFQRASLATGLRRYSNVISALILQDVKSRFFGSTLGYFVSLGWPLTHIAVLMAINYVMGRIYPYGDSALLWFATGVVPFAAYNYMTRNVQYGLVQNGPLLSFPAIKIMDIVQARAIVEILSAAIVFAVIYLILATLGVDFTPVDIPVAFAAMGSSLLLGLGTGIIFGLLGKIAPTWLVVGILILILQWGISGVFFVPSQLPEIVLEVLAYNPTMHVVGMFRAAYFEGYGADWIDVRYTVASGVVTLALAFALERGLRGRILQNG